MSAAETAVAPYVPLLRVPSARVAADLTAFVALLEKWNARQNLVSRETMATVWERHVADSLQLLRWIPAGARLVVDLGSGGGFPAMPLAIASRGMERRFILLEAIGKKASFLRTAARELQLPVEVAGGRIEDFDSRETIDVITARALAPLADLCRLAAPLMTPVRTVALWHKGRDYRAELDEATALFDFDVVVHASESDASGVILEVRNLRDKSER
jgi:16S rRNA (guanine527-N7)-methyltransferase